MTRPLLKPRPLSESHAQGYPGVYILRQPIENPVPARADGCWYEREFFEPGTYIIRNGYRPSLYARGYKFLLTRREASKEFWLPVHVYATDDGYTMVGEENLLRWDALVPCLEVQPHAATADTELAYGTDMVPLVHSKEDLMNLLRYARVENAESLRVLAADLNKRGYGPPVEGLSFHPPSYPGRLEALEIRDIICSHTSYQKAELRVELALGTPLSGRLMCQAKVYRYFHTVPYQGARRELFNCTVRGFDTHEANEEALWLRIMHWIQETR